MDEFDRLAEERAQATMDKIAKAHALRAKKKKVVKKKGPAKKKEA